MIHAPATLLAFTARGLGYYHHQTEGAVEEEAVEGFVHRGALRK
jgi:hypothetical protein